MRSTPRHPCLLSVLLCLLLLPSWIPLLEAADSEKSPHLMLGNPSNARQDGKDKDNYLIVRKEYALSYNNSKGAPNWASWTLRTNDFKSSTWRGPFRVDSNLPEAFVKVTSNNYTGSGFFRLRLCPLADRRSDEATAQAVSVTSNIVPAGPASYSTWSALEEYCRNLVRNEKKVLYIIAGPHGRGGSGTNGFKNSIADGKITVPAKMWKVIVVLDGAKGDLVKQVNSSTRIIAVIVPNAKELSRDWKRLRVSVKQVEALTGYRFLSVIPASVADPLKDIVDDK